MTESELRAKYTTAYRIIKHERRMREHVFRHDPVMLNIKLLEIDALLSILTEFKEALKPYVDVEEEQLTLIDPPAKYE